MVVGLLLLHWLLNLLLALLNWLLVGRLLDGLVVNTDQDGVAAALLLRVLLSAVHDRGLHAARVNGVGVLVPIAHYF